MTSWGIIGFGWVARDYMAPAIMQADGRIIGIADPSPQAHAAAAALGIPAYDRVERLLVDREIDAVYIATPNNLHRAAVDAAVRTQKAVLCEKPIAATLADARAIIETCARGRVHYGTAFDQRWHPAHHAMRQAIREGRIGKPTAVRIVYGCWLDAGFAPCEGHDNWRIDLARAGGGAAIDLAPHGIDLIEFLLGEPLVELQAVTQAIAHGYAVDDGAMLMGRTGSGMLAQLHVSYNLPDALPRRRLEVTGTKGQIVADRTMGQTPGGTVEILDASGGSEPLAFDTLESPFTAQARAFMQQPDAFNGARDLAHFELLASALLRAEMQPQRRVA
ncbi:MAG: Gfo/Idh/MocA family protein [Sphingorhabdus sp.]